MRASDLRYAVKQANPAAAMAGFIPRTKGEVAWLAGTAGALTLAGNAVAGAWDGAEYGIRKGFGAIADKIKAKRSYANMLESNEDLEDSPETLRAFNTMQRFAPDVAKDPMVAGTFVKRVTRFGEEVDPTWVKTLVDIQSRHSPGYVSSGMGAQAGQTFSRALQGGIENDDRMRYNSVLYGQKEREMAGKGRMTDEAIRANRSREQQGQADLALKAIAKNKDPDARTKALVNRELNKTASAQSQLDHMRTLRHRAMMGF